MPNATEKGLSHPLPLLKSSLALNRTPATRFPTKRRLFLSGQHEWEFPAFSGTTEAGSRPMTHGRLTHFDQHNETPAKAGATIAMPPQDGLSRGG
jgi:hypothetical protein